MKNYIKLARLPHWIKNILIFIPAFFGKEILSFESSIILLYGFICFSLSASAIYVLNDIFDAEKDRTHPKKQKRPIASGEIKKNNALIFLFCLFAISILMAVFTKNIYCILIILAYIIINILYSLNLKHKPIIEIVILVSGFLLRLLFGACLFSITISGWLYLTVMSGAFYMALGKRRGEMQKLSNDDRRSVLSLYTYSFLDKNMYLFATMTNVFYALWAIGIGVKMYITVPMIVLIFLKYSYNVERDSFADPVDIIIKDKLTIVTVILYILYSMIVLYFLK